jgi:hypothetical protein
VCGNFVGRVVVVGGFVCSVGFVVVVVAVVAVVLIGVVVVVLVARMKGKRRDCGGLVIY